MSDVQQALKERLELACDAAREAGRLTLNYFGADVAVERKSDNSPVTVADREAEQLLRSRITNQFPDDGIIGEEYGEQEGNSGFRWILDPIDGTKSFIAAVPLYGTLVGVEYDGVSQVGVIELPALDRRVYACRGSGAWQQVCDETVIEARVSDRRQLSDAVYLTSSVASFRDRQANGLHDQLLEKTWYCRTWGDCYGYYLVATGRADLMIDPIVNLWDAAALLPVILEAGGSFSDWSGQESIRSGDAVATNSHLRESVLAMTRLFADHRPQS